MSVLETCVLEVFGPTGVVDRQTALPCFALFRLAHEVPLLDLVDSDWVPQAGATAAIYSGPRARSRDWARALYGHYTDLPGLFYGASRMPRGRSVALFERCRHALPDRPELLLSLAHSGLAADLAHICDKYGLDLL